MLGGLQWLRCYRTVTSAPRVMVMKPGTVLRLMIVRRGAVRVLSYVVVMDKLTRTLHACKAIVNEMI